MNDLQHRTVYGNGQRFHVVEQGEGPLVLLLHGFPESWHSWSLQIPAIAQAGYRVAAPDMRGYGRSSKPADVEAYRLTELVADCVAIVEALGEKQAVVVGHDWGSMVAWTCAWTRPDVFRAVIGMSVAFGGRGQLPVAGVSSLGELKPTDVHRKIAGPDRAFYQEIWLDGEGLAAEAEPDIRQFFADQFFSFSGDPYPPEYEPLDALTATPEEVFAFTQAGGAVVDKGSKFRSGLISPPDPMPEWLARDLDFYVSEYEHTGLRYALNWYRNMDRNWEDLGEYEGRKVEVPSCFLGSDLDVATLWSAEAIAKFPETMSDHLGTHIIKGCGHWITREAPEETNKALVSFLSQIEDAIGGSVDGASSSVAN